jgi:hypothetical protein
MAADGGEEVATDGGEDVPTDGGENGPTDGKPVVGGDGVSDGARVTGESPDGAED